ncbi:hypothetical protein [Mesorhizobium amorphae]
MTGQYRGESADETLQTKAAREVGVEREAQRREDFEIVETTGIHPFYLGAAIEDILISSVGWIVRNVKKDESLISVEMEFSKAHKSIEVGLINIVGSSGYICYYVTSSFARLKGGASLNGSSKGAVSNGLGLIFDDEDNVYFDSMLGTRSTSNEKLSVYFHGNRKTEVSVLLNMSKYV